MRMCRARIRVPDQWYGDYLAGLGSARVAERRLEAFCEKYGKETVKTFMREWFDYSERRMIDNIRKGCKELGKSCLIYMDLAGPKLRTKKIDPIHVKIDKKNRKFILI